jgi:hypothetical protein
LLVLAIFSFGENLEVLAYLAWPALLVLGMAMRRPLLPAPVREAGDEPFEGIAQPV